MRRNVVTDRDGGFFVDAVFIFNTGGKHVGEDVRWDKRVPWPRRSQHARAGKTSFVQERKKRIRCGNVSSPDASEAVGKGETEEFLRRGNRHAS
jgi:hypothetical protein